MALAGLARALESSTYSRKRAQGVVGSAHLLFLPIGICSPDNMAPILLWEAPLSPIHSPQANCAASALATVIGSGSHVS